MAELTGSRGLLRRIPGDKPEERLLTGRRGIGSLRHLHARRNRDGLGGRCASQEQQSADDCRQPDQSSQGCRAIA